MNTIEQTTSNFYSRFSFLKKRRIKDTTEGSLVLGRRVWQDSGGAFRYNMEDFAADRLSPIVVPRAYLTSTKTIEDI